jgi:hypothetical protein
MQSIVNNVPAGEALFTTKATPDDMENALAFNLYGDPSVQLFGTAPQTNVESEDNDAMERADPMAVNDVMSGRMNDNGDVDFFKFQINQHNTTVLIDTDAQNIGSNMDTTVTLYDAMGNPKGYDDDVSTDDRDSLLFRGLEPGWWYVAVEDYYDDNGSSIFYDLTVSTPLLISSATAGTVAGIPFQSQDILAWSDLNNGQEKWVMLLDASDVGFTKPLVNLSRGWACNCPNLAVGFSANLSYRDYQGILRTYKAQDWMAFNLDEAGDASALSGVEYHAGTTHGLSTTAEKIDALSIEDYWNFPPQRVDVYLSTTGKAVVPRPGGTLAVPDEDAYRSQLVGSTWTNSAFFDGSRVTGLGVEDIVAASYYEPFNDMYVTILGTGTVAGHPVTQKDIFRIDLPGHTWGDLVWHGPDHGWNYNIDAFDYPGGW